MKQIYVLGSIGNTRWVIRNQWHKHSSFGIYLIEIGRASRFNPREYVLTLLGFQLVVFVNKKPLSH